MIPARKRRWFAYSLRTLFVLVTLLATALAYIRHRGQARHEALQHLGPRGQYLFGYQYRWKKSLPNRVDYSATSRWPRWLHELVYTENLEMISFIDVRPSAYGKGPEEITNSDLRLLRSFPELEHLGIHSLHATDDGIASLSHLSNLRTLTLRMPSLTDRGVQHLTHLRNVQQLNLLDTQVTDDGVNTLLRSLPQSAKVVVQSGGNSRSKLYDQQHSKPY